jgi:type IV secretion system protein VirD4
MSLPANEGKASRLGSRLVRTAALSASALFLVLYLAGYFFLWSAHLPPNTATSLTIWRYAHYYGDHPAVRRHLFISVGVAALLVSAASAIALLPQSRSTHGNARFARTSEISTAGLLGEDGIILGELRNRYLMLPGQQGVALSAPPRSGKGAGIVIPNLLNWPGSLVCVDIKRENWTITAGFRATSGQETYLFEPLSEDGTTARWNPFFYVSPHADQRVNDLQRIAAMFYPEIAGADPFWIASARSLFLGIALYLFETPSLPKTIGEVLRQGMASDDEGFGAHWKRVIAGRNSGRYPLTPACARALSDVIDLAPVTASSIRKTFTSRLDLWLNPILDAATAENDFDLRDLRRRRMSIYVAVNPNDLHRLRPILSLFFEQAIGLQTAVLPEHDATLVHQVVMMLDEGPALGLIPILAESISYTPGYNVRVVLVFQAPSQLRHVYGENNAATMLKSLGARIVFTPKDHDDAQAISDDLGFVTIKARSRSRPMWGSGSRATRGTTVTVSEERRALLLPQEVRELGTEKEIVFVEGLRPVLARKIRYWKDRRFRARLLPPPHTPAPEGQWRRRMAQAPSTARPSRPRPTAPPDSQEDHAMQQNLNYSGQPQGPSSPQREYVVREATVADLDRLDTLTLEDFDIDVSKVPIPNDRNLTARDIEQAAQDFLAALRT